MSHCKLLKRFYSPARYKLDQIQSQYFNAQKYNNWIKYIIMLEKCQLSLEPINTLRVVWVTVLVNNGKALKQSSSTSQILQTLREKHAQTRFACAS